MLRDTTFATILLALSQCANPVPSSAQARLDAEPILYRETIGDNQVKTLFDRVASGEEKLDYSPEHENLLSILDHLNIPVSSQTLVFSKTSLQIGRISPSNPRAFFFNDDVVVGWVRGSSLLEVATSDPKLGTAFYTVRMTPRRPTLRRADNLCLGCHEATSEAGKVPVQMIRSVMTRESGKINLLLDAYTTDHSSPFSQRWGGWYVSGSSGTMRHMGNAFLHDEQLVPIENFDRDGLAGQIELDAWPSPHSDIVALLVLEHQTEMHNRFTQADFAVRRAEHEAGRSADGKGPNPDAVAKKWAETVVDYMLFCDEIDLTSPVVGASSFQTDFPARGPFADDGRSLRELDLNDRLFKYPCSYLIYSSAFDSLRPSLQAAIYRRLFDVLNGVDLSERYAHLSESDRTEILAILRETKDALPEYWDEEVALSRVGG